MDALVDFSARGTKFQIPKKILERRPESLLSVLGRDTDIPIDKIDDCIYIDINPIHISYIVDYYIMDILPNMENDIYLYMDLKYIGLIDDSQINIPKISFNMKYPIIYDRLENYTVNQKWCRIHTLDSCIVIIDLSTFNQNGWNKLSSIIFGFEEEFLIGKSDKYIDVWIGLNKKFINIIISIIRDGLNWYFEALMPLSQEKYCEFLEEPNIHPLNQIVTEQKNIYNAININNKKYDPDIHYNNMDIFACRNYVNYGCKNYNRQCSSCVQNHNNFIERDNNIFNDYNSLDKNGSMNNQKVFNNDVMDGINILGKNIGNIYLNILSLNKINKYDLEHNQNIMTYLNYYGIYTDPVDKQLLLRLNRSETLENGIIISDIITNNGNITIFTDLELEFKKCIIERFTPRLRTFREMCDCCENFKKILMKYSSPSVRDMKSHETYVFENIDTQLNSDLSDCVKDYIYGL